MSAAQHLWTSKDYARKQPLLTAYVLETICKESPIILTSHEHIWTSLWVPANVGFRDAFSIESSVFQGNRHNQAWICMVMNDTGELVQTTTTKTRKSKKGKGLNQNALHTCFCCHRKTNVVKLELNRSPSWLSYLGLLFHHFRSISNFCFRPDDEKGGKWGQETAFIFGQIR